MPTVRKATVDLLEGFEPHRADDELKYRELELFADAPLWTIAADSVRRVPHAPAVSDAHSTLTYQELDIATARRAAGLRRVGLAPGDRVILQYQNSVAFAVTLLGSLRAGIVPVLTLPAHRINEISHLASVSRARGYICHDVAAGFDYRVLAAQLVERVTTVDIVLIEGDPGEFDAVVDGEPNDWNDVYAQPDCPALFLVSGGTTGLPKLIPRTHNDYRYNVERSCIAARLTEQDVYLTVLPAAHNFPLGCPGFLGVLSVGGHAIFAGDPSPDHAFELIERHGVTVVALVPALAQVWTAATEWEPADVSTVRLMQVGGAKLAEPDAVAANAAFSGAVQQVFGMAEGLICYTLPDDDEATVIRTQGRPMSEHDDIRIVDEHGSDVPDGTEGELMVRGPYTIRGYYRADEHNARSFTGDGYYRSGDLVRRTPSGHLMVTGRIKDTIVRGGENVAADDVEENLLAHPTVRQAAVLGLPDPDLGERICAAVVVYGTGLDLPSVRQFLTARGLATFKQPDELRIVRSLPVTAVGKIDKRTLLAQLT
ncbi:(2,3-dihydroxybenzoyl)adenylate synthase [Rhodococcoides kyotonense]|uniref:Mycobactin salicyl-AMP ligase n=1 Tax=Rhodococcoides kyotonense TaxID=398843 RepID=A0A239N398_9NOCA|nr:AMP-binding protein [Rhodococcus kyotonensis]SNT49345.1 mycobactin salicyl-AMP ligase [Rhodococcus kyotonensis]